MREEIGANPTITTIQVGLAVAVFWGCRRRHQYAEHWQKCCHHCQSSAKRQAAGLVTGR
jgi:hypothetical protein